MIEQCLSNKNENATVAENPKFCELNKAYNVTKKSYRDFKQQSCFDSVRICKTKKKNLPWLRVGASANAKGSPDRVQ